jgi:hypothetical protein
MFLYFDHVTKFIKEEKYKCKTLSLKQQQQQQWLRVAV